MLFRSGQIDDDTGAENLGTMPEVVLRQGAADAGEDEEEAGENEVGRIAGGMIPIAISEIPKPADERVLDRLEIGEDLREVFAIPQEVVDDHEQNRQAAEEIDFPDALLPGFRLLFFGRGLFCHGSNYSKQIAFRTP